MKTCGNNRGFTLAELIMAMIVVSIILAAVATLASALGSASSLADDVSAIQSKIRYTTLRFDALVRNSKLICYNTGTEVAIWTADTNGDNKINPSELVYIETGAGNSEIKLLKFSSTGTAATTVLTLANINTAGRKNTLIATCSPSYTKFLDGCSSVAFTSDVAAPYTKRINMLFGISLNGVVQKYQCSSFLRAQAGYMLDGSGAIVASDDDL